MPVGLGQWICCQLGAREHYAVPRALHRGGALACFITDSWVRPNDWIGRVGARLHDRFHAELNHTKVLSFTNSLLRFEFRQSLYQKSTWDRIMQRNSWFQRKAASGLLSVDRLLTDNSRPILFAYSYAAQSLLRSARERGWRTVLGQIDPGPAEERIVGDVFREYSSRSETLEPVPSTYWDNWREECELADCIVVNSSWSMRALEAEGVPREKMQLVPLAYDPPAATNGFVRIYPEQFTAERPLRVLFLGQINYRKGIQPLLRAADQLSREAVEFCFVGPVQCDVSAYWSRKTIRWIGPVPRSQVADYYRKADVLIFPTFSDGFGLTQLEAQAWKLPVIASANCGDVIQNGRNGIRLSRVTEDAIRTALLYCLGSPEMLGYFSKNCLCEDRYSLSHLSRRLLEIQKTVYEDRLAADASRES